MSEHVKQIDGVTVLNSLNTGDFASLTRQTDRLHSALSLTKVVFFGSSASGKSTVEKAVREASRTNLLQENLSVPKRVVTRPARPDDRDMEYCTEEEFATRIAQGSLGMHGVKVMERGRTESFGFEPPVEGTLPVYFSNNGIVKYPERIQPLDFLQNALLIAVYAPDTIREQRLRNRSPELFTDKPEEAAFRLSPDESSERMRIAADISVNNYGKHEGRVISDVVTFLRDITA